MTSLYAAEERSSQRDHLGDPLQVLDRHIDFAALATAVDAKLTIGMLAGAAARYPAQPSRRKRSHQAGRGASRLERAKRSQKDVQARWTKKHGESKRHANTDRRWGFIRRHEVTAASVNDTTVFETILDATNIDATNTDRTVCADRGYAKHARETELHINGYRACIQRKGSAGQPISEAQQRRNRRIAKQRVFGEHAFARLAQMGGKHLRTIGLARATAVIGLKVIAHNVMHLARPQQRGIVPV